jgi:hypothetical protein
MLSWLPDRNHVAVYAGVVDDAMTELAAYFYTNAQVPDAELVRLTRAARVGGRAGRPSPRPAA